MAKPAIANVQRKLQSFLMMREFALVGTPMLKERYPSYQEMHLVVPPPEGSKSDAYGFTGAKRHELCYLASNNVVYRTNDGYLRVSINLLTLDLLWDMPMPIIVDKPSYPVGRIYANEIFLSMIDYYPGMYIQILGVDGVQTLEVF